MIMLHTLKNIKYTILEVLFTKFFVLMIDLAIQLFSTEEKYGLLIHRNNSWRVSSLQKVVKKHCNKDLVMSEKDEQLFQSRNK